jgi:hypothetical protein
VPVGFRGDGSIRVAAPQFGYVAESKSRCTFSRNLRPMSQLISLVVQLDHVCGQLATAIQGAQMQLYAMLALAVVVAFFAVPRKDDPDQI